MMIYMNCTRWLIWRIDCRRGAVKNKATSSAGFKQRRAAPLAERVFGGQIGLKNPPKLLIHHARFRERFEKQAFLISYLAEIPNLRVAGSNPAGDANFFNGLRVDFRGTLSPV